MIFMSCKGIKICSNRPGEYWKMRVMTIYEDEREMIVTYVSTCGLQRQSNEADKDQIKC